MRLVLLTQLNGLIILAFVVPLFRQTQVQLIKNRDLLRGIFEVLVGAESEQRVHTNAVQIGRQLWQLIF